MKRTILCFLLALGCCSNAQTFDKGTIVVTTGYGVPNLIIIPFRVAYKIADHENVSFSAIGPLLFRAEYGISDKIGIGIGGGYSTANVSYTYKDWNITKTQKIDYKAKVTWASPSLGLRFNFHFANSEKLDPYLGAGLGWTGHNFAYSDDSPWEDKYPKPGIGAMYLNFGLGFRYYFAEHFGMYLEAGWDKASIIQAGVALKF